MRPSNFFNQSLFDSYIKKIRTEENKQKSLHMLNALYSWMNWLKEKRLITEVMYTNSIKQLDNLNKRNEENIRRNDYSFEELFKSKNNSPFQIYLILFVICSLIFNIVLFKQFQSFSSTLNQKQSLGRVLPFKGVIKETDGKALDTKRDAIFKIYNAPTGGEVLYTGTCVGESALEPSYNGSFTILIGSDCGMKPIPEEYFDKNDTLYLGVTIGSDQELTPRYQIVTSTLAKDTGKLQGLPLGKTNSSVPFINEDGLIEIETESPVIKSTNGQFTIEGKSIVFKSLEQNSSIMFDPALGGSVILTSGRFGIGTLTPESILDVSGSSLFNSVGTISNLTREDEENTSALKLQLGTPKEGTDSQFLEFYAGSTETEKGVKVGDIRLNNGGVVYETKGADFAEYFELQPKESAEVHHILSISSKGIHKSLPNEKIIGAVSNTAGFIGNNIYGKENAVLVGLVGQLDVFVSTLNGEIKPGDKIGAIIIPGFGGKVSQEAFGVGYALEGTDEIQIINDACPTPYKRLRDNEGRRIRCGILPIIIDTD